MPKFDGNYGIDGLLYSDPDPLDGQRYLPVRHATWLDAIRYFGWETVGKERTLRPLMARDFLGRWIPLGDRKSLTGSLCFQGPMIRGGTAYAYAYGGEKEPNA